jgi:glycosyltransferase involved in cell wall biosynthesis
MPPTPKKLYVVSFSTDKKIFIQGSPVQMRMKEYAKLAEEFHIIVLTQFMEGFKKIQIAPNAWVYPTGTYFKWWYPMSAYSLAKKLFFVDPNAVTDTDILKSLAKINLVTTQDPFETGLAGYWTAKKIRAKLHLQIHTDFLNPEFAAESLLNKIRVAIAKFLLKKHPSVRVVSQRIKSSIYAKLKLPPDKMPAVAVMPIFVDMAKWRSAPDSRFLHEKYPGFDLLILMVSRFEREKRVALGIRLVAAALMKKSDVDIGLVIVGGGSEEKYLKSLAQKEHVANNVFFEGWVDDLSPYYKSADALLVTSQYEGYGLVFAEASASGCPVITFDIGAAPELVNRWNGIVCAPGDEECLLNGILGLANDPGVRAHFVSSAREAATRLTPETKAEHLAKYKAMWEEAAANEDFDPFV